jgi:hypothetical protein
MLSIDDGDGKKGCGPQHKVAHHVMELAVLFFTGLHCAPLIESTVRL